MKCGCENKGCNCNNQVCECCDGTDANCECSCHQEETE